VLRSHWFSIKQMVHELCQEVVCRGLVPRGVSCSLHLGHGDSGRVPWSANLEQVSWAQGDHVDNVLGDKSKIMRVLRMLLVTALERTSSGSIKLGVSFWPGKDVKKPTFSFSVSDTGTKLDRAWVNERFHSYFIHRTSVSGSAASTADLHLTDDSSGGGCDLGLFVGYHLVQTLGGCLDCVHHEDACGSTFSFTIPLVGGTKQHARARVLFAFNALVLACFLALEHKLVSIQMVVDPQLILHVPRVSLCMALPRMA
jgi:signal transduction histidine kinase